MNNVLLKKLHQSNKVSSTNVINELIMLHKKGVLTDEELSALLRIAGVEYITSEVNKRINSILEDKFYSLTSGVLHV
jgi:hypothetical protein